MSRVLSAGNLNLGLYHLVGLADRNLEMDPGIVIGKWKVVMETMKFSAVEVHLETISIKKP